jgi:hypothetical protein
MVETSSGILMLTRVLLVFKALVLGLREVVAR